MVQIIRFRFELEEPEEPDGLEKLEGFVSLKVVQDAVL